MLSIEAGLNPIKSGVCAWRRGGGGEGGGVIFVCAKFEFNSFTDRSRHEPETLWLLLEIFYWKKNEKNIKFSEGNSFLFRR